MNTLQWLKKLIEFNTVSSNSNLHMIEEMNLWFKRHKITTHIIKGTDELKANLLAVIPASNGQTDGGLLLSGHTDVVPVSGQIWSTDPFVGIEQEGKIYGRGSCDMKGFLAVLLALAPDIKKLQLCKPVYLAFTFDEEVGCIGVDYVVDYLLENTLHPDGCIVGEPSGMRPVIGEKGRKLYHCQVQGKSVHSSMVPDGCNAIYYSSRLICYINNLAEHLRKNGPFDHDFDFPFSTITTNLISGGIASNIVPGTCEFVLEVRYIDQFPHLNFYHQIINYIDSELLPEMRKTYPDAMIYFDEQSNAPGFQASEDSQILHVVRTVTGINERLKVSYSTEAGIYQNAQIPSIICGPGTIEQAHRADEFITIDQLNQCEKVLLNVVHFFCVDLTAPDKN